MENKIGHIGHYVQVFSKPSETFIYDLLGYSDQLGFQNTMLTSQRECIDERFYRRLIQIPSQKIIFKALRRLVGFDEWSYQIKRQKFDLIHGHFGPNSAFIFEIMEKLKLDIPVLTSLHGTDLFLVFNENKEFQETLLKMARQKRCHFTVPSKFMLKEFQRSGLINGDNVTVLPNTFNRIFLEKRKTSFFNKGDTLNILNVGRMVGFKGQKYLIEAFSRFVKEVYPNSVLTIVGDGPLKNELIEQARGLKILEIVKFKGVVSHQDLPELFINNDIYVQPSVVDNITNQVETFGVSVLEAIATGLYVIGTDSGGIPEVISKKSPYSDIVESGSVDTIFEALTRAFYSEQSWSNNSDYLVEVLEMYGNDTYKKNLSELYHKLI